MSEETSMTEVETQPRATKLDNKRHERFCLEYVKDFNATQAYIRAGYSPKGAKSSASELLANPNLISRVQYLVDHLAEKLNFEGERVMLETAMLSMSDIRQVMEIKHGELTVFDSDEWSEQAARAVSKVEMHRVEHFNKDGDLVGATTRTKVEMHAKVGSLALLSQQLGLTGKGAKRKPLRPEELGIVILPRLADEPDWDRIEDGDPRYSLVQPPKTQENGKP